jgi:predicted amidophosphoribosyltransferase
VFFTRICDGCGTQGVGTCVSCVERLNDCRYPETTDVVAAFVYEGFVREMIIGLKYRNHRANASVLIDALIARMGSIPAVDVLTWVPTTRGRIRKRGVDHAELLARPMARRLGLPVRRLLHKTSNEAQTGRSRQQRAVGPVFVARPLRDGPRVLVIDDVVTTGASLDRARAALVAAGAAEVVCVAVAATPAPVNTG